jgi:hypothetical protein
MARGLVVVGVRGAVFGGGPPACSTAKIENDGLIDPKVPDCSARCRYTSPVHTEPVFADPSGYRRRLLRRLGLAIAAALVACLAAILVSMAGGPQAPLTHWAAPISSLAPSVAAHPHLHHSGRASTSQPALAPGQLGASTPSASPSSSASLRSGTPTPSPSSSPTSPVPTNPAGHTPPGQSRPKPSKSPSPHVR